MAFVAFEGELDAPAKSAAFVPFDGTLDSVEPKKGIIASAWDSIKNLSTSAPMQGDAYQADDVPTPQVKPSAGGGRGSVNPPIATEDAPPQTSGSYLKDAAINVAGGAIRGVSDFGKVINTAIGREDAAQSADSLNADVSQWQKENGGDTFYGKVADMVGAIAPTLAVGEGKLVQFAV